jgi:diguanylate cyclase
MDDTPQPAGPAVPVGIAAAERDLERVQRKVDAARQVLLRLLQEVVAAEGRLSHIQAALLLEANEALVVSALRDQVRAQAATQALAEHARAAGIDPLTQLPNRVLLQDRFDRAIAMAKRRGGRLALLFVDLDQFKQINDTLGHAAGDETLQQVARLLTGAMREADTVSRHGGDEFLVLVNDVLHSADAAHIADKVQAAIGAPVRVAGRDMCLTASIGISIYPDDGEDVKTLVDRADAAMYSAKQTGPGSFAFHGDMPARQNTPLPQPAVAHGRALAEYERRNAQLQEANERLLLAALDALALPAAAKRA